MTAERDRARTAGHLAFGPFSLSVPSRLLLRDGAPVAIGSRSLDILIALVEHPGEVVGKRELIERVWPGLTVDESSLRVHVNGLRRALGDGQDGARYVANVPGRGYAFVASLTGGRAPAAETAGSAVEPPASLPPVLTRMVGREEAVQSLASQVLELRFVSLVGPGGIGKTTVAVKASHQLRDEFDGEIFFVNLSVIVDPQLVHVTVASILSVTTSFGDPLSGIVAFLRPRRSLLVLDSCEHLIEPVAALTDAISQGAPEAHLLTTTREALRVEGEHVVRLAALACPPEDATLTAAESLAYSAVELFVERASASVSDFKLTDEDAPIVAELCRKLDGVALAIELGAGRVEAYGLAGTAQLLDSRLGLLWQGRRTAPPRHQTLTAMLDWSYGLLGEAERTVLARLAIFAGPFTLDAARAVAADDGDAAVVEIVAGLVAKSLVSPIAGRSPRRFRLLDTTRAYALEKLASADDRRNVARRHALFFTALLAGSDEAGASGAAGGLLESVSDVRAALEWSFREGGDTAVGVALAAAAATPLLEHSLLGECYGWAERAIAHLGEADRGSAVELELQTSLGWSALFATGKGEAMQGAFLRGLEIADSNPDPHQQLRLLGGLNIIRTRMRDYAGALSLAERGEAIARRTCDEAVIALAEWTLGVCHHLCGHHAVAVRYCESAVRPPARSPYVRKIADYGFDHRGRALIARARSLWLLGFPDRAVAAGHVAIEAADELGHPISLCIALLYSATVFIWSEDWAAADSAVARLVAHSESHGLMYRSVGVALRDIVRTKRGDETGGVEALRRSLEDLVRDHHLILVPMCRTTIAEALLTEGRAEEARAVINVAAEDLGSETESVDGPEVMRVRGAVLAALGQDENADASLRRAIALAHQQSALSWELRAATSLARLKADRGEANAASVLAPVLARFTEGFETGDLRDAAALLERLAGRTR